MLALPLVLVGRWRKRTCTPQCVRIDWDEDSWAVSNESADKSFCGKVTYASMMNDNMGIEDGW
jgi:hypothetical protein